MRSPYRQSTLDMRQRHPATQAEMQQFHITSDGSSSKEKAGHRSSDVTRNSPNKALLASLGGMTAAALLLISPRTGLLHHVLKPHGARSTFRTALEPSKVHQCQIEQAFQAAKVLPPPPPPPPHRFGSYQSPTTCSQQYRYIFQSQITTVGPIFQPPADSHPD